MYFSGEESLKNYSDAGSLLK